MNNSIKEYRKPVVHQLVEDDPYWKAAGNPPRKPFEKAGAEVVKLSWENRPIKRSLFQWPFPDYNNENLQRFRERYDFLDCIKGVNSEWERLLLLREWLHRKIPARQQVDTIFQRPYPNEGPGMFKLLDTAASGCVWWCPHFSTTLRNILIACGYQARHVGNVSNYNPEEGAKAHGVTDVFVQEFGKWVQLDAHFNVHYEVDGIPLSPWEIGEEYHRNNGKDVDICVGLDRRMVTSSGMETIAGKHESSRAMWNQHRMSTDPFTDHGSWFGKWGDQFALTLIGERHEGQVCHRGGGANSHIDAGYAAGRLQDTVREADVYPDIGTSHLVIDESDFPGTVQISVGTYTPNFDTMLVKINDRPWGPTGRTFKWFLHESKNTLQVRTRDKFGNLGKISSINAHLKKKV